MLISTVRSDQLCTLTQLLVKGGKHWYKYSLPGLLLKSPDSPTKTDTLIVIDGLHHEFIIYIHRESVQCSYALYKHTAYSYDGITIDNKSVNNIEAIKGT